jgi:hypothetical protein
VAVESGKRMTLSSGEHVTEREFGTHRNEVFRDHFAGWHTKLAVSGTGVGVDPPGILAMAVTCTWSGSGNRALLCPRVSVMIKGRRVTQ